MQGRVIIQGLTESEIVETDIAFKPEYLLYIVEGQPTKMIVLNKPPEVKCIYHSSCVNQKVICKVGGCTKHEIKTIDETL